MFLQNRTWNSQSELGNGLTTSKATYNQTMFLPKPQVQSGKTEWRVGLPSPDPPQHRAGRVDVWQPSTFLSSDLTPFPTLGFKLKAM